MSIFRQKGLAFLTHFLISLLVIGLFVTYMVLIAYTHPILKLEGGYEIAGIVFSVDLILGPIMTAILYRQGKKGLKGDLVMVVVLQVSAFLYGAHTLYSERPAYLVYLEQEFWVIPASTWVPPEEGDLPVASSPLLGPTLAYVEHLKGKDALAKVKKMVADGKGVQFHPEYYQPLVEKRDTVVPKLDEQNLVEQLEGEWLRDLDETIAASGRTREDVVVAKLFGNLGWLLLVLDRVTLERVGMVGPKHDSMVN